MVVLLLWFKTCLFFFGCFVRDFSVVNKIFECFILYFVFRMITHMMWMSALLFNYFIWVERFPFVWESRSEVKYKIQELYCFYIWTVVRKPDEKRKKDEHIWIQKINNIVLFYIYNAFYWLFIENCTKTHNNKNFITKYKAWFFYVIVHL